MSQIKSFDHLIELHLDGQLEYEQYDLLITQLKESEEARAYFWRAIHMHHTLVELADQHWGQINANAEPLTSFSIEEQAEINSAAIGVKKVLSTLCYQSKLTAIKHRTGILAAAGITVSCLIGIVLLLAMTSNKPVTPVAIEQGGEEVVSPIDPTVVAALTAEHNAVWDRRPGHSLYAGQHLTLTQGFAEITTNDGAIAILEAPVTVEMLDMNALRLHSGKLSGICETPSSKGFVVRTPLMDVTDLGTKFGVVVNSDKKTEAHVYEGEVQISTDNSSKFSSNIESYYAGQAVQYHEDFGFEPITLGLNRFSFELDKTQFRPHFEGDPALWLGRVPADLTANSQESRSLQVFIERDGVVLDRDVSIDLVKPKGPGRITAGESVDIYLLHLDSPGKSYTKGTYTIRFDRPILGVAYTGKCLASTDSLMAGLSIKYPTDLHSNGKNIDPRGSDFSVPKLIENGTAIQIEFDAQNNLDQLLVLVRSKN